MQKIMPCLWFDRRAEEAAKFYVSIFKKDSRILNVARYTASGPGPEGSVMTVVFQLNGEKFMALNGGPVFQFSEATSFVVRCKNQKEIDYYWEKLSKGGRKGQCGWIKDRYGLSWQIVPSAMREFMTGGPERAERVMNAILKMKKLDLKVLQKVFRNQ